MILRSTVLAGAVLLSAVTSPAGLPPGVPRVSRYPAIADWDANLAPLWAGWKSRFLAKGLVQGIDPGSGQKRLLSESQSYGLLLSVWMDDQAAFDSIWTATEATFWNPGGGATGWYRKDPGSAEFSGNADMDICGALIFASALVDSGRWTKSVVGGATYKQKAITVLKSITRNVIDRNAGFRVNSWPGAGDAIRNPSHHMPAWYPIFQEFATLNQVPLLGSDGQLWDNGANWDAAAAGAFALLEAQPNARRGMARNLSNASGGRPSVGTGVPYGSDMGFDAIRVPLRVAHAAIWYPGRFPRAVAYARSVWALGGETSGVDPARPGMYSVEAATLLNWEGVDPYRYEPFLTRAMWGSLAVSVMDSDSASAAAAQRIGRDFGRAITGRSYLEGEATGCEPSLASSPCNDYYAQTLGLLGALVLGGRATNVWADLKHLWGPPDSSGPTVVTSRGIRDEGVARLSEGGVHLHDRNLRAGDLVQASVFDTQGRTLAAAPPSSLSDGDDGLFLSLPLARSHRMRVLELTVSGSGERRRYLLGPTP